MNWINAAIILGVCGPIVVFVPRLLDWFEARDPHKMVWVVSWDTDPHTWLVFWSEDEVRQFIDANRPTSGWGNTTVYSGWVKEEAMS